MIVSVRSWEDASEWFRWSGARSRDHLSWVVGMLCAAGRIP